MTTDKITGIPGAASGIYNQGDVEAAKKSKKAKKTTAVKAPQDDKVTPVHEDASKSGAQQPAGFFELEPAQPMSTDTLLKNITALEAKYSDKASKLNSEQLKANLAKETTQSKSRLGKLKKAEKQIQKAKKAAETSKWLRIGSDILMGIAMVGLICSGAGAPAAIALGVALAVNVGEQVAEATPGGKKFLNSAAGKDFQIGMDVVMVAVMLAAAGPAAIAAISAMMTDVAAEGTAIGVDVAADAAETGAEAASASAEGAAEGATEGADVATEASDEGVEGMEEGSDEEQAPKKAGSTDGAPEGTPEEGADEGQGKADEEESPRKNFGKKLTRGANTMNGLNQVVQSKNTVDITQANKAASDDQADADEMTAALAELKKKQKEILEALEKALKDSQSTILSAVQTLSSENKTAMKFSKRV